MSVRREAAARRSRWLDGLLRDDQIGPKALAVLLVLGQRADLAGWPRVPLSNRSVAGRLQVDPEYVSTVAQAASALGYLESLNYSDKAERTVYRATFPAQERAAETTSNPRAEAA